jgi:hypothetical protein
MNSNQAFVKELLKEKQRLTNLLLSVDALLTSYGYLPGMTSTSPVLVMSEVNELSIERRFMEAENFTRKTLICIEKLGKGDVTKISQAWLGMDSSMPLDEIKKKVYPSLNSLKNSDEIEIVPGEWGSNNSAVYRIKNKTR